ncbi:uncharacterized protein LOC129305912 isoform X2 [Prosopis cineraria]|uniref:uncharacterized protein LOC129305912 isoform X2 n=1 Tax=Prosopis cineraria TaxID=364024 RepID=UPI00240F89CD|nr:uncharacterized protein LOC129305912 isoform X2 [Prosopis cineraria]
MTLTALLLLFLFFLLTPPPPASSTATGDEALTAYDMLGHYHFPKGLLPKGVIGYELDQSTGRFRAFLDGSCSFSLEGSYQLEYKSTISGYISRDRLTNLEGVKVKVLLFWFNIVEVVRYGDDIEFSVGIASASFPLENFLVCPRCGCGLNCDDSLSPNRPRHHLCLSPSSPYTEVVGAIALDPCPIPSICTTNSSEGFLYAVATCHERSC